MTGTLRNHFSRACNKRVNQEKEWKRKRVVKNTCESWSVRPGAFRREFDYTHSADSKFPVPRYRQFRRSKSATTRMIRKRAREDKFNRLADNLPEDNQTWYQAEEEDSWNNWVQEHEKDSLVYQKELDEESKYADDYALVMKFGSDMVRLPNTFTYSNKYFATGDCCGASRDDGFCCLAMRFWMTYRISTRTSLGNKVLSANSSRLSCPKNHLPQTSADGFVILNS